MDRRPAQHIPRPQQQQAGNPRFSWQEPVDSERGAVSQGQQQQQLRASPQPSQRAGNTQEDAVRGSILDTPVEMRAGHQNWPSATQRKPSEPVIPQSPASPATSPPPEKSGLAPEYFNSSLSEPNKPNVQSDHTTPLSSGQPTPPASYAVLPQSPNAPLPAQSPPLSINTTAHLSSSQAPLSPAAMAPIPYSQSEFPSAEHAPATATTAVSSQVPYTPYSNLHTAVSENGTAHTDGTFHTAAPIKSNNPDKARPFAPDDLIHTRNEEAAQRAVAGTFNNFSADTPNPAPHQPGQILHPNMTMRPEGTKDTWQHSLFACAPDADTCCLGLFCPCIIHSRTAYRLDARSNGRDPTDLLGFSNTNPQCMLMGVLSCVGCLFPMVTRTRIRHSYKLEGGVGGDLVTSCCCCCCVAVQNEREVKGREEGRRKHAGPGGGEGYKKNPSEMRYVPGGR